MSTDKKLLYEIGKTGICPVCGSHTTIIGLTTDNRLIGRCDDRVSTAYVTEAFTYQQWMSPDE